MYLDIKNTIWERIQFDNVEQMNDVVEKLKSGRENRRERRKRERKNK